MKVAVIGFGHIGRRHSENIMNNPNMELVAICDPYVDSEQVPFPVRLWKNYEEMVNHHSLDLIVVATPNHLHYEMVDFCLESKVPVLAEKPLTLNTHEAKLIQIKQRETGTPLFVNYPLRFLDSIADLKSQIECAVGNPRILTFNVFWNRNEGYYGGSDWRGTVAKEGGPLFNEFVHHLNLIRYLFGDISVLGGEVFDFAHDYTEVEDSGMVVLKLKGGGLGTMTYTVACPNTSFDVDMTVIGDLGCAKLSGLFLNRVFIDLEETCSEVIHDVNLEHFSAVLEAIRLNLEEGIEDDRLCYVDEASNDVSLIQSFYSRFKLTNSPKGIKQPIFLKETF